MESNHSVIFAVTRGIGEHMTRAEAINKGLIAAGQSDHERNECLRKVRYYTVTEAFSAAERLASRSNQDGKRLKVYCCIFCRNLHIGNYQPNRRTVAGQIAFLQSENRTLLGRISSTENELSQCRASRDRLRTEIGQLKAALSRKSSIWMKIKHKLAALAERTPESQK